MRVEMKRGLARDALLCLPGRNFSVLGASLRSRQYWARP